MKRYLNWLLLLTTLLAFALRFWHADDLPSILNRDEAALAYNAYLLSETGQDEWQRRWPLALESFGDYKLLGYPLLLVPIFKLFGLSDLAVRLPSILAGTLLVPLVFLLAKRIKLSVELAWLASLLVAVSPVFIWFSRMAFEANLALTYLTAALFILFDFKQKAQRWHAWMLLTLLGLAIFTYNTPLLLLPFLLVFTWLVFAKKDNKKILIELILGSLMLVGFYVLFPLFTQKSGITIFTDETVWQEWINFRTNLVSPWQTLLGSRYLYYLWLMGKNLIASLSPQFLVTQGSAHPWHGLAGNGHLFAVSYFLGLLGLAQLIAKIIAAGDRLKTVRFELAWLWLVFASLAPAIITVDAPHATRSLLFFVLWQVTAVMGLDWLLKRFTSKAVLIWRLSLIFIMLGASQYAYQLFMVYPNQQHALQPQFDQVVQQIEAEHPTTPVAIVDPAGYHYILLAWYLKLPPETYFNSIIRQNPDQIGFRYGQQLTHYHFIANPNDRSSDEPILVQWSEENLIWQIKKDL